MTETTNYKPKTVELICTSCGKRFIFRSEEASRFKSYGWSNPVRCQQCRKEKRVAREQEKEQIENNKWQKKKAEDKAKFETLLKDWHLVNVESIVPKSDNILYVIGNGFDLMHGVKSSYYSFRDFLGRHSTLREELDLCLTADDIWADFEGALAKINVCNRYVVNNWLENFDAFNEDAGAAEYYMAIDMATTPIISVAIELPKRFRAWVEQLSIKTNERPLKYLFGNGKVLCFNYTEFVETMYGVTRENVCYLHGNRRKGIHGRKEQLILGHLPGASDESYSDYHYSPNKDISYREAMVSLAQDNIIERIVEHDRYLTKNSKEIISEHKDFFGSLSAIEKNITIGHSFSEVDWDYYIEIVSKLTDKHKVNWQFGCHSLRDLCNLEKLLGVRIIKI